MLAIVTSFFASSVVKRILPYVLIVAAALAVVAYVDRVAYNRGYDTAVSDAAAAAAAERERQAEANRRAWERAMRDIDELTRQKEEADALIARLRDEGRQDPDAGRPALSAGSVRRVDSIQ